MCLVLYSPDGHLDVKMLVEQLFPKVAGLRGDPSLEVTECYDFIVRLHATDAERPVDHLYILSPHRSGQETGLFQLLPSNNPRFDNAFVRRPIDNDHTAFAFEFDAPQPFEVEATALNCHLEAFDLGQVSADVTAVWRRTGFTVAKVVFDRDQRIYPFHRDYARERTYWFRLAFTPVVDRITDPIPFGPEDAAPLFHVQPSVVLGQELVVEQLRERIASVAGELRLPEEGDLLHRKILEDCFWRRGTSARIEDHRIHLVLEGRKLLLLNGHTQGACAFHKADMRAQSRTSTREWYSGTNHFIESDPLGVADHVNTHLMNWARNADGAKTKEEISTALPSSIPHLNISHATEVLAERGYIARREDDALRFFSLHRPLPFVPAWRRGAGEEVHEGGEDMELRQLLYGEMQVPGQPDGVMSRFDQRSMRIYWELAIAP